MYQDQSASFLNKEHLILYTEDFGILFSEGCKPLFGRRMYVGFNLCLLKRSWRHSKNCMNISLRSNLKTFILGYFIFTTNVWLGFKNLQSMNIKLSAAGSTCCYNKKETCTKFIVRKRISSSLMLFLFWFYESSDKGWVVVNVFINPKQLLYFVRKNIFILFVFKMCYIYPSSWKALSNCTRNIAVFSIIHSWLTLLKSTLHLL